MKTFVLSLAAAALALAGCSSDAAEPTTGATDTGTGADTAATDGAPADTGGSETGADDTGVTDTGGSTVSSDPNAPTSLAIGATVTTTLAADGEHFFEYTPTASGDHTLRFVAASNKWYANHSTMKDTHFCGPPQCAVGTADAPLKALVAGTTYYLNVYNGTGESGSYTISVTNP